VQTEQQCALKVKKNVATPKYLTLKTFRCQNYNLYATAVHFIKVTSMAAYDSYFPFNNDPTNWLDGAIPYPVSFICPVLD
jgi:hypothetical protein